MQLAWIIVLSSLVLRAAAQSSDASAVTLTGSNADDASTTGPGFASSSVTYSDYSETISITATGDYGSVTETSSTASDGAASATNGTASSTSATVTVLSGGQQTSTTTLNGTATANQTSSSTSSAVIPTNTVPCNGHVDFCQRRYSNITHIAAHNSPFIQPNNIAANQMLDVTTQLNDGIRMLQFQTHLENGTVYLCHTSCDLLNAGTLESYLRTVTDWLRSHPTDIITILMGNYDVITPQNYTAPVVNSGLIDFVYTPPQVPMPLAAWPTLAEMIFANQRAVVMLDYEADQLAIPWLLDEFGQMWESPFSPTDRDFPCTVQRPPDQARADSEDRMMLFNQNLNVGLAIAGIQLDVPAVSLLNETNAVSGYGSAGASVANCTRDWGRPPTFLLVDYYNIGSYNGSVFEVAAIANNVTYNGASCCGADGSDSGAVAVAPLGFSMVVLGLAAAVVATAGIDIL